MSKNNRSARKELERICGKGCFFIRANCAKRIEEMGGIKTYKVFLKEKRYKGKKISSQISYHHLVHKSEGGKATVENGANVGETAHAYLHSLPRDQEEIINNMLREFKIGFGIMSGNGEFHDAHVITVSPEFEEEECIIIDTFDCTKAEFEEMQRRGWNQQKKYERLKNPTRAMNKRDLQRRIDEEEEDLWR